MVSPSTVVGCQKLRAARDADAEAVKLTRTLDRIPPDQYRNNLAQQLKNYERLSLILSGRHGNLGLTTSAVICGILFSLGGNPVKSSVRPPSFSAVLIS